MIFQFQMKIIWKYVMFWIHDEVIQNYTIMSKRIKTIIFFNAFMNILSLIAHNFLNIKRK